MKPQKRSTLFHTKTMACGFRKTILKTAMVVVLAGVVLSCSSRKISEENAWWEVNLTKTYPLGEIEIYNRTDANQEALKDFTVVLSDADRTEVWTKTYASATNPKLSIAIGGVEASFVKIQLNQKAVLNLAEVIVRKKQ